MKNRDRGVGSSNLPPGINLVKLLIIADIMKLNNKVAIITGSSSGIGEATAILFAKEGAKVVVNCKTNIEGAKKVVKKIKSAGGDAFFVQADVSNPKDVKKLFEETIKKYGTVDILINNAGDTKGKDFLESKKEDWLYDFNNNFFGTVLCSQEAAKIMLKRGSGKILNTSSVRGLDSTGREGIIGYSAAKAAVINFTKTLAKHLAPKIQVNAIAPGFVKTPNFDDVPQETKDNFINKTYLKRWINPLEIAEAFLYLATADAITGEVLVVDAGFTLKEG
jgi:3-oxoacyl-[acyl-carrier protein] reductase